MMVLALRTNSAVQASGGASRSWLREARKTLVMRPSFASASSNLWSPSARSRRPSSLTSALPTLLAVVAQRPLLALIGSLPYHASSRAFFSLSEEWPKVEPMSLT